jgi:hypothetical protein
MRRVSIAFLVAGGLAGLAGTLVPDPDTSDHAALGALAVASLALAAVLRGADADVARAVAERVRLALRDATALARTSLTLSVGIAERSDKTALPHELLEAADRALYLAKARGRDQAAQLPAAA